MPLHPVLPLAAFASLAVLLAGCGAQSLDEDEYGGSLDGPTDHAGGQTGSASIGNPPECVCDAVAGAVVLRAVVDELTTTDVVVEVTTVLASDLGSANRVQPGTRLQASYQIGLPCTQTEPSGLRERIAIGSSVLVHIAADQASLSAVSSISVVPWEPTLQLTECAQLSRAELPVLLDGDACWERFVNSDPPPELTCGRVQ